MDSQPADVPPTQRRKRVLVVENHAFFRENLVNWIGSQPHLECCCQAESYPAAQAAIDVCKPDLVLLDLTLNGKTGIDFLRWLNGRVAEFPTIVLSQYEEQRYADAALQAGARGYVSKAAATEELLPAITAVLNGQHYVSGRGALPRTE